MNLRLMGLLFCLVPAWLPVRAANDDAAIESVITASFADRSISAIASHLERHQPFKRAILLLPGSPGMMKIQSVDSYELKGNFLIRSRKAWLDRETIVFSVDAPTDEWRRFSIPFRASARYAEDIRGLVAEIGKTYGPLPLVVVGTSEGSISAYYAARALAPADVKVIFTSSLFNSSRTSTGLAALDFDDFKIPMLWVHHADDPCTWTPYWQAKRHAEKTHAPLITVRSNFPARGDPCMARSQHGYIGVETETVLAMKNWVISGEAKDLVVP